MLALELKNISKTFGQFKANDKINLSVKTGEVHAILGENGAGKSTLMKIIFGLYQPDKGGKIYLKGREIKMVNPSIAIKNGIGMVHQHFMLVRPFTVLQNIILGVEPKNWYGAVQYKKARNEVLALSETYHFNIDPDQIVDTLTVGMQQRIEIIKTLYRNAELIILDEPTASLTPLEIEEFYKIVRNLKHEGKTIIIITHKLGEIKEIADRCTIIRKGQFIETVEVAQTNEEDLAKKMVGRKVDLKISKKESTPGEKILCIKDLNVTNDKNVQKVSNLNLSLYRGEILGLAGIDGNGQSELVDALTGLKKIQSGSINLKGLEITHFSPRDIYENKLSMIPEDRQRRGLVLDFKIKENFVLQRIEKKPFSQYGFIIGRELEKFAREMMERFDIRPRNTELSARNLSGGNQQKIILAREIANNPDVLIAFLPTRGLDVGAIEFVHQELLKLRDQDKAILLISYELDEVINLSDRIAVIERGNISIEISPENLKAQNNIKEYIGLFMAGGKAL